MPIGSKPTKVTEWASSGTNVIEPTEGKKDSGFVVEKPAYQTVNWIWNNLTLWERYYESYLDTITNTNVIFDDTAKQLRTNGGNIRVEQSNNQTVQTSNTSSAIEIKNTDGTGNNFSDLRFINNINTEVTKISSQNVNHTDNKASLSFWTRNGGAIAQRMTILPNGNIGIGASPTLGMVQITKSSDANTQMVIENGNTGVSAKCTLRLDQRNQANTGTNLGRFSMGSGEILEVTNNDLGIFIDTSGKVGFNAQTPTDPVHIAKNVGGGLGPSIRLDNPNGNANSYGEIRFTSSGTDVESKIGMGREGSGGSHVTISTSPFGNTPLERFRVTDTGHVGINHTSPTALLELDQQSLDENGIRINSLISNYQSTLITTKTDTSSTTAFSHYVGVSGGDVDFRLRGDGNAFADGSFSGGGADYAEFFESSTGREIAIGTTVVLEADKVRIAGPNEVPFGVVRPNDASCIVGNNSWNHWKNKYLKDDFGQYLREDVQYVSWMQDVNEEREVQKTEKKTVIEKYETRENGHYITRERQIERDEPVFIEFPVVNEDGVAIFEVVREEETEMIEISPVELNDDGTVKKEPVYESKVVQERVIREKVVKEPVMETVSVKVSEERVSYKVSELGDITPPDNAEYWTVSEKVLNPDFDPDIEYIPPADRPEQVLIGLLGQVPVLKSQPIKDTWHLMKSISDNVDLYYIS